MCNNCVVKALYESKINNAWENTLLSKTSSNEFTKNLTDHLKISNFLDCDVQLIFYQKCLITENHYHFFDYIIRELTDIFTKKKFRIMILFIFLILTKSNNSKEFISNFEDLKKNLDPDNEIQIDFLFLNELLDLYIYIVSKLSLFAYFYQFDSRSDIDEMRSNYDFYVDAFSSKNILRFKEQRIFLEESCNDYKIFFEHNFDILNQEVIRSELLLIHSAYLKKTEHVNNLKKLKLEKN